MRPKAYSPKVIHNGAEKRSVNNGRQADVVGVRVGADHPHDRQAVELIGDQARPQFPDHVTGNAGIDEGPAVAAVEVHPAAARD